MKTIQDIGHPQMTQEEHISFEGMCKFELTSWIGRTFYWRYPPSCSSGDRMLNLGAGNQFLDGFTNADFFSIRSMLKPRSYWMLDLRFPICCKENYWDGVFMEHTLEHLYPDHARALLLEIFRILKPGAWLRLIVPDLRKYIQYYRGEMVHSNFRKWAYPAEAIHTLTQRYFHHSVWDDSLLSSCLKLAGFVQPSKCQFREGSDARLLQDSHDREWESLYMEAQKPTSSLHHGLAKEGG